jgi:hypothetical protein
VVLAVRGSRTERGTALVVAGTRDVTAGAVATRPVESPGSAVVPRAERLPGRPRSAIVAREARIGATFARPEALAWTALATGSVALAPTTVLSGAETLTGPALVSRAGALPRTPLTSGPRALATVVARPIALTPITVVPRPEALGAVVARAISLSPTTVVARAVSVSPTTVVARPEALTPTPVVPRPEPVAAGPLAALTRAARTVVTGTASLPRAHVVTEAARGPTGAPGVGAPVAERSASRSSRATSVVAGSVVAPRPAVVGTVPAVAPARPIRLLVVVVGHVPPPRALFWWGKHDEAGFGIEVGLVVE